MTGKRIAATYANGAFKPDGEVDWYEGDKVWILCEDRFEAFLPEGSPLAAAEREFELAFANGGWDEARAREGCRLAWETIGEIAARVARARGWAADPDLNLRRAICQLEELDSGEYPGGDFLCYSRYRAAEIFRERASADEDDISLVSLGEIWQFEDGLRMAHDLAISLESLCGGAGSAA